MVTCSLGMTEGIVELLTYFRVARNQRWLERSPG